MATATYNSGWTVQSMLDALNPTGALTNEQILAMPFPLDPTRTVAQYIQDSQGTLDMSAPVPDVRDSSGDAGEMYDKLVYSAVGAGLGAGIGSWAGGLGAGFDPSTAMGSWDSVGGLTAAEQAALGGGSGSWTVNATDVVNPSWQDVFSGAEQAGISGVDMGTGLAPSGAATAGASSMSLLPSGVTEFFKANPWLIPAGSALAGALSSGGTQSATTSTTTAAPPSQVSGALSGAANLLPGAGGASAGGSLAGSPNNLGLAGQSLAETMLGNFMLPNSWNPYGGQTTQVPTNPYYGQNNPYLQGVIDRSAGDVTSRIQAQFNKPGGYGGSANQEILARELSNLNNQIRYQDYGLQANLGEQDVNRRLSTSLADLTRNAGLWQNDMARNTANYQAERGRQLSAALGTPGFQTGVTESQFAPYANYANLFKGWGSNQTTQYPQGSAAQGALGGALSGYALSRMFG